MNRSYISEACKKGMFILLFTGMCLTASAKNDKVTVVLDWYINPDHGPLLVADAYDYFKDNNLDVKLISATDASSPSELVAAGKADVAVIYEPQLIAQLVGGMPIEYAGTLIDNILCCMVVLEKSEIDEVSDLKNKKIGYASDGTNNIILESMLLFNGVDVKDTRLVNIQMNLSQALLSGKVDAVYGMMRNVEPVQLAQMGVKTRMFFPENNGVPIYCELLYAVKKGNSNSDKIKRFFKAVKQGVHMIKKDPEGTWGKIAKKYKSSLAMTPEMEKHNHKIWGATVEKFDHDPADPINHDQFNDFARFLYNKGLMKQTDLEKVLYK